VKVRSLSANHSFLFTPLIIVEMAFSKLVRFEHGGRVSFGDLVESSENGFTVNELSGSLAEGFSSTSSEPIVVQKLLSPLESTPIVQCIGLNYKKHAAEANLTIPKYPVVFTKPADALTGPFDDVHVHPDAQKMLDYEGELSVVIGKDAKNVSEADALDYVLGYTAGNDVSARDYQLPDVSGGQFCYSKSFDQFAPIGQFILSTKLVPDPQKLEYVLRVNGEERQRTGTDDMIWSVKQIIAHLSRGTTLRRGTVILTGTPSGVGFFQKKFLKDGDVVEMEILGWGCKTANKMVFD